MITQPSSPTLGERLRRDWPWVAIAIVIVLTAAVLIIAKLTDDEYETSVGQVVFGQGEVTGFSSYVELPTQRLTIVVSKPRSSLEDHGNGVRPAPEGGSFIGLRFEVARRYVVPGTESAPLPSLHVVLVAGGRSYPVSSDPLDGPSTGLPLSSRGDAWVAVTGSPTDARIAVDYGGVRQIVDPRTGRREAGRAAVLYQHHPAAEQREEKCSRATLTAGYRPIRDFERPRCQSASSGPVPYIAGLGWAPAGKQWLAVAAVTDRSVTLTGPGSTDSNYYSSVDGDVTATLRLGVQRSRGAPDTNLVQAQPGSVAAANAQAGFFIVDENSTRELTVVVTVTYHRLANARRPAADAPVEPTVSATWKVAVSS